MRQPLFEFSGACAGCGETPYIKLMSQLFGDHAIIGNATGCTSIYGGNLPTTPYTTRPDGKGPAWSNSLFEDAAEFAYGMRLSADKRAEYAAELLASKKGSGVSAALVDKLLNNAQAGEEEIEAQRASVVELKAELAKSKEAWATELSSLAEDLIKRSVWGLRRRRLGLRHRLSAAWTTSSPPAATSTSWCSTPRSTPTPAARPPSPRPSAPSPSSPPRARTSARRTSA